MNAHATSTLVGDVAEVRAVRSAFPDMSKMKMNSTKSMIGHCLGAAGGMEAIATLKAIQTGWVHPTLNQVRSCLLLSVASLKYSLRCIYPMCLVLGLHKRVGVLCMGHRDSFASGCCSSWVQITAANCIVVSRVV